MLMTEDVRYNYFFGRFITTHTHLDGDADEFYVLPIL